MDEELARRFDAMMRRINDNHETVLSQLRDMRTSIDITQADVRSIRANEIALRTFIGARAGETETFMTHLFDLLNARLDQSERSIEERLRKLEGE